MKKNYFLIVGMLLLMLVGVYFGMQKFTHSQDKIDNESKKIIDNKSLINQTELEENLNRNLYIKTKDNLIENNLPSDYFIKDITEEKSLNKSEFKNSLSQIKGYRLPVINHIKLQGINKYIYTTYVDIEGSRDYIYEIVDFDKKETIRVDFQNLSDNAVPLFWSNFDENIIVFKDIDENNEYGSIKIAYLNTKKSVILEQLTNEHFGDIKISPSGKYLIYKTYEKIFDKDNIHGEQGKNDILKSYDLINHKYLKLFEGKNFEDFHFKMNNNQSSRSTSSTSFSFPFPLSMKYCCTRTTCYNQYPSYTPENPVASNETNGCTAIGSGHGCSDFQPRRAIDLANRSLSNNTCSHEYIFAPEKGQVIGNSWSSGYGNVIRLQHDSDLDGFYDDEVSILAHMSAVYVSVGEIVNKNELLGLEGNTGSSTGEHLHMELRESPSNYPPNLWHEFEDDNFQGGGTPVAGFVYESSSSSNTDNYVSNLLELSGATIVNLSLDNEQIITNQTNYKSEINGSNFKTYSRITKYPIKPDWFEPGPEKVYEVNVSQDGILDVELLNITTNNQTSSSFNGGAPDLDVFITSSQSVNDCIGNVGSTSSSAIVTAGVYYVVVDGGSVSDCENSGEVGNYEIKFLLSEIPSCTDNYEPNDMQSQATPLYVFGHDFSWSDSLVDECLDQATADIDWYRMNLTHQGELTITLSSQQISSLFMDWLDSGNVTSSTTVNGNKQIVICSNNGPACYDTALRVYTVTQNGNDPIPYTLDIQWSANQSCTSGRQSSTNNSSQNNSTVTINGSTNVCEGLSNNLTISGASGPFDWFVNGQSVHIGNTFNTQSLNTGQYDLFVIATDDVCSFAETQLNITSGVTANAGSNVTIQSGGSTTLQGSGGSSCSWSPTTGLSNPNSCTTAASPTQTTTYTLTVTENGCTDTDTVTVTVDGSSGGNPPANDDCSDAITLTSSTSCNYTTGTVTDATPSFGANNCLGCSCTSPDDYDVYFKFTAVETSHTVTVSNYASNFDAVIELRTACSSGSSNYISCYDPTGAPTSVSETWTGLTVGQTYYIRIFEWGYQQSPPNSDSFDICVTHQSSNTDGIDLVSNITSVSNDNPDAGNQITVNYAVTNNGDVTMVANTTSALYLSSNQSYDSTDILLDGSVQAITTNLTPNQSISLSPTVTIPSVSDGQYYIISYADSIDLISESNETNNTDAYIIQIGDIVQNGPDLDVTRVRTVPDTGLVPGQEVEIEIRIENEGNEDSSSFDVLVYLDIDGDDEYDSNEFMGEFTFNSLDAGENDTMFVDFDLPANIPSSGVYELFAVADSNNDINETDEGNNDKDDNITIALANGGAEDVALLNESINITTVNAGGTVDVVVNHVYLGSQTTDDLPTLNLAYYLSTDCNFSVAEDTYLDDDTSNLGINNPNVEEDETLTIPASTPSGVYYILFIADSDNEVEEGTLENNNVECIQITVNGSSTPDGDIYITDEVCNPTDIIMGSEIEPFANIHYTGSQTNADLPSIEVFYFLSNDCTLSNDDLLISDDSISLGSDLPVNDASDVIELPSNLSPGTYYIIFRADMENDVYETNENNNIACAQFNLLPADANYQDVTFNSPYVAVTEASFGDQVYASIHQNYTGYQADADIASIRMEYYLSTDCTLSADDYYFTTDVSSLGYDDPSQFEFATLTIPSTISSGDYYVLFVADTEDIIAENNEGNNTACVPITISETLGIDDNELINKIKVYPNPVSDILTINLGKVHSKINLEIFNVIGQKVNSLEFEQKQLLSISTNSLSNGIYFFKIKTDSIKSAEFKIIKE